MGDPHLAAMRVTFRAEGWSGTVELESGLDSAVANTGVARYAALALPPSHRPSHRRRGPRHRLAELPHHHLRGARGHGRAHPGRPRRAHRQRAAAHRERGAAHPDRAGSAGRTGHRGENRGGVHLQGPRDERSDPGRPRRSGPGTGVREAARLPPHRMGTPVARGGVGGPGRGGPRPSAAPVPHPADALAAHRGAGRGRPGPRPPRRGVPRPCLLGRALRAVVSEPPLPRGVPGPAALPPPAAAPGVPRRRGRRAGRGDVSVAERWRRA